VSITAGAVAVLPDGTYTATGVAKTIFEYRYAAVVGDLELPNTQPPNPPMPPVTLAMLVGILQAEATKAVAAANRIVQGLSATARDAFPNTDGTTTPASGGFRFALIVSGGTMTGTPTIDVDGTAHTISRSGGSGAGSFMVDGFHVGQNIAIGVSSGSSLNTAFTGAITKVTPTKLYFASGLTSESGKTNLIITSGETTVGSFTKDSNGNVV
jgi:hypothetical protein